MDVDDVTGLDLFRSQEKRRSESRYIGGRCIEIREFIDIFVRVMKRGDNLRRICLFTYDDFGIFHR